jgi:hypothetical protein
MNTKFNGNRKWINWFDYTQFNLYRKNIIE